MAVLIVVEDPSRWPLDVPGTEIVPARRYITDRSFVELRRAKVFNLCRTYGYQSTGYYVSLLAAARGHKPLPSVTTIQDLRQNGLLRVVSSDIEDVMQRALAPIASDHFELSIYFGRNMAKRYDRLCNLLFGFFPAPLLRAEFVRSDDWRLQSLRPIASNEIPDSHREFVVAQAQRFFARPRIADIERPRYEIAILVNPDEVDAPSDDKAIQRFSRAARRLGMRATTIGRQDYGRIAEFDGLFIRETTAVNHHTYRFARRAAAEGLAVIDDPESIVRCSNKVYQAELFEKHDVPAPRTIIVHRDNADQVGHLLGYPVVLKRPDSSFSAGVKKADNAEELAALLAEFFRSSELVVAQEFVPSSFDWRVGVLNQRALYVCRYHMARGHWQIQRATDDKHREYGRTETMAVEDAPPPVTALAVRAATLIGNGLYGVDIKETSAGLVVMEINDNPSIESGIEDAVLKDALYDAVMQCFYDRIEQRGTQAPNRS